MCRLVETILLEDGLLKNIEYHNDRFNRSRRELFGITEEFDLRSVIKLTQDVSSGQIRCRVIYSEEIHEILFTPYVPISINSFKLMTDDDIEYSFKYLDRSHIEELFAQRGDDCDDIIIVKRGLISDASSSNIAFFDGKEWHTPAIPLLRGICRARLLIEKKISERRLTPADLARYKFCSPFNAMRGLGEIIVPVNMIMP